MTVSDILEQAQTLSAEERKELAKRLIDMIDTPATAHEYPTGAEIVDFIRTMPDIEFVDDHIEDPVEWVETQRKKRSDYIQSLMDAEES